MVESLGSKKKAFAKVFLFWIWKCRSIYLYSDVSFCIQVLSRKISFNFFCCLFTRSLLSTFLAPQKLICVRKRKKERGRVREGKREWEGVGQISFRSLCPISLSSSLDAADLMKINGWIKNDFFPSYDITTIGGKLLINFFWRLWRFIVI